MALNLDCYNIDHKIAKSLTLLVLSCANFMLLSQVVSIGNHRRESRKTSILLTIEFWQIISSFSIFSLGLCAPIFWRVYRLRILSFFLSLAFILLHYVCLLNPWPGWLNFMSPWHIRRWHWIRIAKKWIMLILNNEKGT